MSRHETKDVIVLIPGICGSVLAKDGKEMWGTSASSVFRALKSAGDSIQNLKLDGDDPKAEDLGDKVTAPRLVETLTMIPGFWKIDGYTKVRNVLIKSFGLTQNDNYFEFPYDWRRDNRAAARRLDRQSVQWLEKWKKKSGNQDAKLVLIGHSMGGLISRYFLEVLGGWQRTRSLITFGTPYRGAPKALNFAVNGFKFGVSRLSLDLSPMVKSFTSMYQLIPIYPCIDSGTGELTRAAETPALAPFVDLERVKDALKFHREIESNQAENAKLVEYRDHGYRIAPLIGIEQPTYQSAVLQPKGMTVLGTYEGKDEGGDGTVPRVSAIPIEMSDELGFYVAQCHGAMQNTDDSLAQVRGVITAPNVDLRKRRLGPPISLSLAIEDAYLQEEPVRFKVTPSEGRPELLTTITNLETNEVFGPLKMRPQADNTQAVAFDPLPEGLYRVSIDGPQGRVSAVSDGFVVASTK